MTIQQQTQQRNAARREARQEWTATIRELRILERAERAEVVGEFSRRAERVAKEEVWS